jgi:hypothetical protein
MVEIRSPPFAPEFVAGCPILSRPLRKGGIPLAPSPLLVVQNRLQIPRAVKHADKLDAVCEG